MDIRSPRSKRNRGVFAVALTVSLVLVLSVLGGVGLAKNPGAAQKQYEKKVTLCHKGKKTISVGKPAAKAHLKHGDTLGPCASAGAKGGKAKGKAKKADQSSTASAATQPGSGHGKGHGKK